MLRWRWRKPWRPHEFIEGAVGCRRALGETTQCLLEVKEGVLNDAEAGSRGK